MATSTLNVTGEEQPELGKGHGTEALGPSDSSDSGSDVVGGPGLAQDVGLGLDRGNTSDPDVGGADPYSGDADSDLAGADLDLVDAYNTAGPDVGDANLDSDSDSSGTGERATAGRDSPIRESQDISVDCIVGADEVGLADDDYIENRDPSERLEEDDQLELLTIDDGEDDDEEDDDEEDEKDEEDEENEEDE